MDYRPFDLLATADQAQPGSTTTQGPNLKAISYASVTEERVLFRETEHVSTDSFLSSAIKVSGPPDAHVAEQASPPIEESISPDITLDATMNKFGQPNLPNARRASPSIGEQISPGNNFDATMNESGRPNLLGAVFDLYGMYGIAEQSAPLQISDSMLKEFSALVQQPPIVAVDPAIERLGPHDFQEYRNYTTIMWPSTQRSPGR